MISALLAAMNWEVCMIFCTFSGAVHDFYPYRGLKIMHTTDFVAEILKKSCIPPISLQKFSKNHAYH